MRDLFFDLNDVMGDNVKIHLRFENEKHSRLPDYGPCDIYLHLKTHEEIINERLFEELTAVHKTLNDKKSRSKFPRNKFKMTIVSGKDVEEENTELYIRRIRTRKGELPKSTKELEVLSFDFILDLLERLLDYIQDNYLLEEGEEIFGENEYVPVEIPEPQNVQEDDIHDINKYTGKVVTGVAIDDDPEAESEFSSPENKEVSDFFDDAPQDSFFTPEPEKNDDFFASGADSNEEVGKDFFAEPKAVDDFFAEESASEPEATIEKDVLKEETLKDLNPEGHSLTQDEFAAIEDRLGQDFSSTKDATKDELDNFDLPLEDPDNTTEKKEASINPFEAEDDDESDFWEK